MHLSLKPVLKQVQQLKPTLQQLQYYRLLQQTNLELEVDMREELSQNPALEIEELKRCPRCGEILLEGNPCITCLASRADDSDREEKLSAEKLDMLADLYSSSAGTYEASTYESIPEDEIPDIFATVVRPITLEEHLKHRLPIDCADLFEKDLQLAVDIIDRIDAAQESDPDREVSTEVSAGNRPSTDNPGLIRATDAELAEELRVEVERLSRIRRRVAELDPVGSGLQSSVEVLALQAELSDDLDPHERLALAAIFRHHLADLAKEKHARVAKKVGLAGDRVKELVEYSRRRFHVHPRRMFEESESNAAVENPYITADVRIREVDGKFVVEILDSGLPQLKVNMFYAESYKKLRKDKTAFTKDERKHIKEYFERASMYLTNLNSRRQTMLDITEEIIRQQESYLRKGSIYLKKLTRKKIAEIIGVHPSTVSRALAVRYCWLPDNSIVSFSVFFDPSLCYIEMIKQILNEETHERVYSDEEIRDSMAEKGHTLSRRVITKYRMKGKIPPSGRRKRLLIKEWKKAQVEKKGKIDGEADVDDAMEEDTASVELDAAEPHEADLGDDGEIALEDRDEDSDRLDDEAELGSAAGPIDLGSPEFDSTAPTEQSKTAQD